MTAKPIWYITTPIYYVNGRPHLGSALSTLCCDALARYHRLRGQKTWFLTGTDEQATKVQEAARAAGSEPQAFVDGLAQEFRAAWDAMHIRYDDFIRTTEPRHVKVVQEVFRRLQATGHAYRGIYEGWYCVSDETFFRETDVGPERLCPNAECRKPLQRVQEENTFFKLSAFEGPLLEHIETHPEFLQPDFRRNEVTGFIRQGLRDMCITRSNTGWGIPVPGEPDRVIYVWFDALVNYLAATGWPNDTKRFEELWPPDVHLMAKEIFVRFHATLWPAMLMALGLPLPKTVYAHGWWVDAEGKKEGKRTGGLPHPVTFAREITKRSGADPEVAADSLRYLLLREMVFHGDTEFTTENFLKRYNADLANDLGNLANRAANMANRYFDGSLPDGTGTDDGIATLAAECRDAYSRAMEEFRFHAALEAVFRLVSQMNRYIEEKAPWKLAKLGERGELAIVLRTCLEAVRVSAVLLCPAMPIAAEKLLSQVGFPSAADSLRWEQAAWEVDGGGRNVPPPQPIFPRIEETSAAQKTPPAPVKEKRPMNELVAEPSATITIDDFLKVQLRVANVVLAEKVENADKLLKLTLEVAGENRTVLAGIAEMYQPEELMGRQVVVVANLQPRKMRGIESQGMLLAADVDGQAILLQPETKVPSGSRVR